MNLRKDCARRTVSDCCWGATCFAHIGIQYINYSLLNSILDLRPNNVQFVLRQCFPSASSQQFCLEQNLHAPKGCIEYLPKLQLGSNFTLGSGVLAGYTPL